jgi:hypothetical protein
VASLDAGGVLFGRLLNDIANIFGAIVTSEYLPVERSDSGRFLLDAIKLGVTVARCVGLNDADIWLAALESAGTHAVDVRMQHRNPLARALHQNSEPILIEQLSPLIVYRLQIPIVFSWRTPDEILIGKDTVTFGMFWSDVLFPASYLYRQ